MKETLNAGTRSEEVNKARALRLKTLLHELVREEGRMEAAALLGVNYKTLVRAMETGRVTGRMRDALHRLLGRADEPELSQLRKRMGALEENFAGLAEEMRRGFTDIKTAVEAHGHVNAQSQVQERKEVRRPKTVTPPSVPRLRPMKRTVSRRKDPELVTVEPAPDDAEVYGNAWPLVAEWRELRADHPHQGTTLSWLTDHLRLLTLELAMMEQHELTLPPEKEPLRGFGRRGQTAWRREAVRDTQNALAKRIILRWVRRLLTLGLWWK